MDLSNTVLTAASLGPTDVTNVPNGAYGTISLNSGGSDKDKQVSQLAAGWLNKNSTIQWTGRLPLGAESYLVASISVIGSTEPFRLNAIVEDKPPAGGTNG